MAGGERQSEFDAERDDRLLNTQESKDFDIRRIWHKIIRKKGADGLSGDQYYAEGGDPNAGPRVVYLNNPPANKVIGYGDNHISTTKYNIATFIPKFLFEQFSKYANLFFLCTALIQQVPNVSPTNRYTTIGTLAVVLSVSAVKELSEDFKRRGADRELNSSKAEVLSPSTGEWITKKWIKVAVGDIVRVKSENPFPADLVLLASSEPEGLCYIETANLDGETNLKIKQAHADTAHLVAPGDLARLDGKLESEKPNSSLYTYEATLNLNRPHQSPQLVPLSPEQLLLRGATLRNTAWVHGLVVFTGHETKLMRNATATPIKRTAVEHMLNLQIIFLFAILIILAVVASLGNVIKIKVAGDQLLYLHLEGTNLVSLFFSDILTYWVLFSNLVPISLFVTVEVIKFYQAYLISSDLDMYYAASDTPTVCRTSSLVEELGQIEYIFSDKTGTLTCNVMEFRSCTIAGRQYTAEVPEDGKATMVDGIEMGFHDFDALRNHMINDDQGTSEVIQEFFTLLAACHTVIPEADESDGSIKYQAASPDEGALVDGAAKLGYKFLIRRPRSITLDIRGQQYEYELLNICEFNSTRKRMSAIFRCPDGKIRLYCKGADTVILERLSDTNNPFVESTLRHLEDFASEGLRTLCLATRVVSDSEYATWAVHFNKASTSLGNRSQALDDAAELIEKDLYLLGATAIEDKLQDGVPETIRVLQEAGIKIWVLTGDRQETAINIGMSCKLLSEDMSLLMVNELDREATRYNINKKLAAIRGQVASSAELDTLALVIDGKSLGYALEPELEKDFLDLAVMCKAVICCRVSPLQKALVVKLVKRHLKALLLAIGDGANDVSMIQAAHVGVGISGMEGMQAARSADVAIGQFKYLRKLLLVHGAWSYHRLSKAILYSFYKNIALYMTQFWYVFQNGFSGQSIYESWTITFYNVFFTVLPPFVIGVFDQYISARLLDRYPQLYQLGQKGKFFNTKHFWQWVINGFYHSIILFYGSAAAYRYGTQLPDGLIANHWVWGTALYTSCVLTALGKAALVTNLWTKFTILAIPGSFLLWLGFFPAYAVLAPLINVSTEYRGVLSHLYSCLTFWVMISILPLICLLRDLAWKYYKRMYYPESYHYVQEIQKYNIADYRPRMEQFQKAIRKVRQVQRMRKQRGFAFSQADEGQERIIRAYDTTQTRGKYGEMKSSNGDNFNHNNSLDVFF
ncbi:aminophospholipid translocase that maintains membrane lipid asymmetry in post-golgi secre [Nadsonia fulvescens var. elongata DSM 6958]|uniref:Phospholipid-transporting ATPase n=1 Tax=Nadsonia fulvescens var. elongata DSM 6958 TaxID=857566 RepID=A0A1E3PF95_9ASCO|nr:aminophospholipid translocase that maintains membrane lipid asymmetry in post-golgi secre [Nadsonia fulvescens var. elongata DSM 6958]